MKNLRYSSRIKASPWRKISLGSWRPTGDSSTYSWDDLDITELEKYAEEQALNIHTMILKALSLTVDKHPEVNRTVRFGRIYQREVSSVFFHVLPDEGDDLSGLVFRAAHEKATEELNKAFLFRVKKAKEGKAPLEEGKKIFQIVPGLLSKWVLDVMSFVNYSLNLRVGAPADAFGSVMLTSVGSLDIPRALTPIAPYTKNSMVVSMGTARNAAVVKDGVPAVSRLMTFGFVFDHRLMEGKGFASFIKEFRVHFRTTRSPDQIERIEWMQ